MLHFPSQNLSECRTQERRKGLRWCVSDFLLIYLADTQQVGAADAMDEDQDESDDAADIQATGSGSGSVAEDAS